MGHGTRLVLPALFATACATQAAVPPPVAPAAQPAAAANAPEDEEFVRPEDRLSRGGRLAYALLEDHLREADHGGEGPDPFDAAAVLRREPHARAALDELLECDAGGLTLMFVALSDPKAGDQAFDDAVAALEGAGAEDEPPRARSEARGPGPQFVALSLRTLRRIDDPYDEDALVGGAIRVLAADPRGVDVAISLTGDTDRPRARLVGLCGVRKADPEAFRAALRELDERAAYVPEAGDATSKDAPRRDDLRLSAAGDIAFRVIERVRAFRSPVVGEGAPSIEGFAMGVLLGERDADRAFKVLAREEHPAPRIYAACGLRHTDRAAAAQVIAELAHEGGGVRTQDGCIARTETSAEIAAGLERGDYDGWFRR